MYNTTLYVRDIVEQLVSAIEDTSFTYAYLVRRGVNLFRKYRGYVLNGVVRIERLNFEINVKELTKRPYTKKVHIKLPIVYRFYIDEIYRKYFRSRISKTDLLLTFILLAIARNRNVMKEITDVLNRKYSKFDINLLEKLFGLVFSGKSIEDLKEFWTRLLMEIKYRLESKPEIINMLQKYTRSFWEKDRFWVKYFAS